MGSFQPKRSDIDLIFIVKKQLSAEKSVKLISCLNKLRKQGINVDLSVLLKKVILAPRYPILVELRYESPHHTYERKLDREVLAHLYGVKKRGFCLWGKSLEELFHKISSRYYTMAIIDDLKSTRRWVNEDPVYWILNACRTIAFIQEGKVFSKLEGGDWGMNNLPKRYNRIIKRALLCQTQGYPNKFTIQKKELQNFIAYVMDRLDPRWCRT
jgi:streptomycin 3"-adenylyltransferase